MSGRTGARPVGIVAFVFTDLEDSTRRWEEDPDAMRVDVARHLALIDEATSAHGGARAVEQGAGDSTVGAFARASDALRAALAVQVALHQEPWTSSSPLSMRVAVHVGEAEVDADGAYAGPTMNRCGRLLQAAHGGQVVASSTAVELGAPALDEGVALLDLGAHRLRGIDEAIGVVQVSVPPLSTDFPPLRTIDGGSSTLPVPDSPFISRDADIEVVADLVASHRVVTLVGAGGCGKTRLAVEVGHGQMAHFRDGVHWVDLGPISSADALLDATATALGVRGGAAPIEGRIRGHLQGRSSLLVIDNCEHVLDAAAALVADLAATCPTTTVLATSREPLALRDEVVWRVPSLSVPAADGDLWDSDAGRLLVDRIRRVQPGYEPDADDAAALARICRRLDGIPLALELAAARTRAIAPVPLADRLSERFSMLAGGGRDVLPRQRTLEASVAWSHQLLDATEREAFRRLSVFPGAFSLPAAAAVVGGDASRAEEVTLRLVDCSLLVDRSADGEPRFQMLETVRWYARERLSDADEADATFHRHLDWCVDLATAEGRALEGPDVRRALRTLDAHVDDLRAALQWALDGGRPVDAALIVAATSWAWIWRGRFGEAIRWLERAEEAGAVLEPAAELAVAWAHTQLVISSGIDAETFGTRARHLLRRARQLEDERVEGRVRVSVAFVMAFQDPAVSEVEAERGRALCRAHGDRFWEARALVAVALARVTAGRFAGAEQALDELRPMAREIGHPQLIADQIARRVLVDRRFGRHEAVLGAVAEVDAVTDGFTDLNSRALVHAAAAFVDTSQGRGDRALAAMEQMYDRYELAGERVYLPSFALPMMEALIDLGRPSEAIARFDEGWRRWRRLVSWRLTMGPVRGLAHLVAGDVDAAREVLDDTLAAAEESGNGYAAAVADRILAAIERREGEYASAERRLHRALAIHAEHGYPQQGADVLEELAGIELDHGRPQPAATLFGAASTLRSHGGVVRRVGRQEAYEADLARLRDELDEGERVSAWGQGARLDLAEAAAYAARGRGERGRPASGWESLTATEVRVAELVAQGHTNPEVAQRLIMGRATVKTHVSNILRKLGLENRTQLARLHAHREQQA